MRVQLDLDVMYKRLKIKKNHLIFFNFGLKKFTITNTPQKKAMMFEYYNLLDVLEDETIIF
jgi:hypothetical protein